MDYLYKLGHVDALEGLGIVKTAISGRGIAQKGKDTLAKLKQMFSGAQTQPLRGPGISSASRPPTIVPPGAQPAPKMRPAAPPGGATPPPAPSQWVPPGAAKPRTAPTKDTSMLGAPDVGDIAAFASPGQPGRGAALMSKARRYAVPVGLLGGSAALLGAGGGDEVANIPIQQPYYSEMGYY